MTLFPWPEHDGAPHAHPGVLWKRGDSVPHGLLIDSPSVPLQFALELQAEAGAPPQPDVDAAMVEQRDAALQRVREVEHLLAVRDLMQR